MNVKLLGTGGPLPDTERHGSCVVVQVEGNNLMVDCGRGAVMQASKAGVGLSDLGALFITHHHYDHISDIGDLVISSWLAGRTSPLKIYGPPGTGHLIDSLLRHVYRDDIRFRSEGELIWGEFPAPDVTDLVDGDTVSLFGSQILAAEVRHDPSKVIADFVWHPLGFRINFDDKSVCISGDTVRCDGLYRIASDVDVLIQCCYMADSELTNDHLRSLAEHTLASASAAGEIAARSNVGTLILTHFRRKSSERYADVMEDVRRSYLGTTLLGRDLLEVDF